MAHEFEESFLTGEEFDQVEDEDTNEDDVVERLNFRLSWRWKHLFILTWKTYETYFFNNLSSVTFYDLIDNLYSLIQVYSCFKLSYNLNYRCIYNII